MEGFVSSFPFQFACLFGKQEEEDGGGGASVCVCILVEDSVQCDIGKNISLEDGGT